MPIGSVPPNSTQAGALEIPTWSSQYYYWDNLQVTSHWPYGSTYPPAPISPPAIYYELWYKFKPTVSLTLKNTPAMMAISVWNLGYLGTPILQPGYAYASVVTVYDTNMVQMVTGKHVQFSTNRNKNNWYYIKVVTPPHSSIALATVKISMWELETFAIPKGSIMIQEDLTDSPIVVMPTGTSFSLRIPNVVLAVDDNHSVGGGKGDILPNGITCLQDFKATGVSLRNPDYTYIATVNLNSTQIHYIRADSNRQTFWISYTEGGTNAVRSIDTAGNLGPVLPITQIVPALSTWDNDNLYYTTLGSYTVYHRDTGPVSTPTIFVNANYGDIVDLIVSPRGTLLVAYTKNASVVGINNGILVREFHLPTGNFVTQYYFDSNTVYNRIARAEEPSSFYVWRHINPGAFPWGTRTSAISKVRLGDGVILFTSQFFEYDTGHLMDDQQMYLSDGKPNWVIQTFGASYRGNFFISPILVPGGTGIVSPPWGPGVPPDDEYVVGIDWPPYPFDPPKVSPPESGIIGGGLVVIDPDNVARADYYLDTNGDSVPAPIRVAIRTAFLGD